MNKKAIIIILIISIILGIIVTWQFSLSQKIKAQVKPDNNQALAYEVAELYKNNQVLQKQVNESNMQLETLKKSSFDIKAANDTLEENLTHDQIILGSTKVNGPGVKITFQDKILSTQLVDIINAIKNIGVDALSINGQRINLYSSIEEGYFPSPVVIEAIGSSELLYNSLTRPGGIMDQINHGEIKQIDDLILPAVK